MFTVWNDPRTEEDNIKLINNETNDPQPSISNPEFIQDNKEVILNEERALLPSRT